MTGTTSKNRPVKLWIFNHDACSPDTGPLLRHYYFAQHLSRHGYETTIFASNRIHFNDRTIPIESGIYAERQENGVRFMRIKTRSYTGNGLRRVLNWMSYYHNVKRVARRFCEQGDKPDIIIGSSVHPLACVAANQLARKLDIPSIVEIRDLWPEALFLSGHAKERSLLGKLLIAGEHSLYRNTTSIIFLKPGDASHIKEMGWDCASGGDINLNHCYQINNGVDLASYQELKNAPFDTFPLMQDDFNIVYTGSVRPMNNLALVLDAAELLQKHSDIKFYIYGEGCERARLRTEAAKRNLKNIEFVGYINKNRVPALLDHASVALLNYSSSQYNWSRGSSSNKLFEYLASGKPIISTMKMGYSIINEYQCGIELEQQTPAELAKAILMLHNMSDASRLRMGRNASTAAAHYDYAHLSELLDKTIKESLSRYRAQKL